MSDTSRSRFVGEALAERARWFVVALIVVAALAHVPVIGPHLAEAPYMGALFIVLTAACTMLAVALLAQDTRAVYALVAITCGLAVVGYVGTRLVAFPMLADDVGNWLEPLGVVSIASESAAAIAALGILYAHRSPTQPANAFARGGTR